MPKPLLKAYLREASKYGRDGLGQGDGSIGWISKGKLIDRLMQINGAEANFDDKITN